MATTTPEDRQKAIRNIQNLLDKLRPKQAELEADRKASVVRLANDPTSTSTQDAGKLATDWQSKDKEKDSQIKAIEQLCAALEEAFESYETKYPEDAAIVVQLLIAEAKQQHSKEDKEAKELEDRLAALNKRLGKLQPSKDKAGKGKAGKGKAGKGKAGKGKGGAPKPPPPKVP